MSRAVQIEECAALWVLRHEEPGWSAADEAELEAWLAESDAHKVAYWRLECSWREADRIAALGTPAELPQPRFDIRSWWQPLAIAASLLIAFTVLIAHGPSFWSQRGQQLAATEFQTPVGGHRVVTLADGSRVELNTDTAIKAVVNDRGRSVWLQRGEAFFDVAKRPGQAFVIYAGARTITVLGTKFSVRRSPREIVVAVLEGRVRVGDVPGPGPERHATVTAGDIAIARDRSTLVTNSAEAVDQQLAWRNGLLQFDATPLAAAVEQFNRYNRKQLAVADQDAARILIGGSFLARNVDAFARLLEQVYGIDARDSSGRILLSSRKIASRAPLPQLRPELVPPRERPVRSDAGGDCGPGGNECALIPLAPPPPQVQVASAPTEKAIRDTRNWNVLHKLYPPRALAAREEGMVGFTVRIDSSGSPTSCKITHTSGHPLLDLETCQLIMVHATFKRPAGLSPSQQRSYEGVVNWKLPTTARTAVPAAPKPIAEASAPEEVICKRILRTGSNAAFERKCMSKSEWQRASTETRKSWDELQGMGRSCEGYPPRCR